jgi:glycosyltransferase involved in cell wall biosynthesis
MTHKINLLIIKNAMPIGGAETLILQHLKHLDREKYTVHFASVTGKGILFSEAKRYADQSINLRKRIFIDPFALFKLRQYLQTNNISLVHSHDWLSMLYIFIVSFGLELKKVVTIHAQIKTWRKFVSEYLLQHVDNILTVSHYQKLTFFEKGLAWQKMKVIYNCYDSSKFNTTPGEHVLAINNPFKIIMVGNYYWQKDQLTLIDAISIVHKAGYHIELHLVGGRGSKELDACIEAVSKKKLTNVIYFLGQKEINSQKLAKYDLFAFSTRSERMPIAPIEAMASAVPVLVSDIPPNMELIRFGQDGFYFMTGNSGDCARAIIAIIENPTKLHKKKTSGLQRAREFTPQVIVRKLETYYQSIIDRG